MADSYSSDQSVRTGPIVCRSAPCADTDKKWTLHLCTLLREYSTTWHDICWRHGRDKGQCYVVHMYFTYQCCKTRKLASLRATVTRTYYWHQSKQSNLSHYSNCVRHAVANIWTQSVPSILWLEDAHLIAYGWSTTLLYKGDENRWVVFNETGSRGYICLYFTGSHFDVMCG